MKRIISNGALAAVAAGALLLSSCSDRDMFNPNYKAEEYAANWESKFGQIDPNQDWSMATKVTAKANIPGVSGESVLRIFSANGASANQKLLVATTLVDGKGDVTFDAMKGCNEIFATVFQGDKYVFSGLIGVENGVVNITPNAKRAKTRAGGVCPVTLNDIVFTHTGWDAEEKWDEKTYKDAWNGNKFFRVEQENDEYFLYYSNTANGEFKKIAKDASGCYGWNNATLVDGTLLDFSPLNFFNENTKQLQNVVQAKVRLSYPAKFYRLNNQSTTEVTWTIGDCKELFWEDDAFFREGVDYRSSVKRTLYESQGKTVADMETGVIYTTASDNSQIDIPMMYGATCNTNLFGYYYYTDNQDSRTVNRYVLYDDASPSTNIKVDGTPVGNQQLEKMEDGWTDASVVTCTSRRLVYFGEDGTGTPTYDFPKGVHIGFFIARSALVDKGPNFGVPGKTFDTGYAYSTPSMNENYMYCESGKLQGQELNAWTYRGSNDEAVPEKADQTRGNVKAITWKYNGKTFMGFGDDSGDCDLNDFVCWIDGDFEEKPPLEITTTPTTTTGTRTDYNSWILACEDLGSTDDYDFNDIVLEVKKVDEFETTTTTAEDGKSSTSEKYKGSKLYVKCLAAGGTLPANISYDNIPIGEAHALLGANSTSQMINTVNGITNISKDKFVTDVDQNWTLSDNKDKFKIAISSEDNTATIIGTPDHKGIAPQIIILPEGWEWPTERTGIETAYPNFTNWSANAELIDWNTVKIGDKVVSRPTK